MQIKVLQEGELELEHRYDWVLSMQSALLAVPCACMQEQ